MIIKKRHPEDGINAILSPEDISAIRSYLEDYIGNAYEPVSLTVTKLALWSGRVTFGKHYGWFGKEVSILIEEIIN